MAISRGSKNMRYRSGKMDIKSKAGMTLIEVLVAMTIFAVVAVPLFSMFSNSIRMERRALVESLTTYTAQMMMEEQYGKTEDELLDLEEMEGEEIILLSSDPEDEDSVVLNYLWNAELDEYYPNLINVKLTVRSDFFEVETTLESLIRATPPSP